MNSRLTNYKQALLQGNCYQTRAVLDLLLTPEEKRAIETEKKLKATKK